MLVTMSMVGGKGDSRLSPLTKAESFDYKGSLSNRRYADSHTSNDLDANEAQMKQQHIEEQQEGQHKSQTGFSQIDELLHAFAQIESPLLDLSAYQICTVPAQLMTLSHLEYLYLCDNQIEHLPDNFFPSLPNLKWLDLRFNKLRCLPKNISISRF